MTEVPEGELEEACRQGRPLDGRGADGAKRSIDAALLRDLCHERRHAVDPRGIEIHDAVIAGQLDVSGIEVPFPLRFHGCEFEQAPVLHGATLADLAFIACPELPGLLANGVTIRRDLDLSRSQVTGGHPTSASTSTLAAIWLCEASIGGRLLCAGTTVHAENGRAIQADRIRVGGTVRLLSGFRARGEVRLVGARIDGSLHMSGFELESSEQWALALGDANIGGALLLLSDVSGHHAAIYGRVDLRNATISGQLLIRGATLVGPGAGRAARRSELGHDATVVSGARLTVGAGIAITGGATFAGTVDLSASDLGGLSAEPGCAFVVPGGLALDLTNAELRSSLVLGDGVSIRGTLGLVGAHVRGSLNLVGATLSEPEGQSLIKADGVRVDGNVDLSRLTASGGRLKFWRATIDGGFDATGAQLINDAECTLRLHQSTVGGSVRLVDGFTSRGFVQLNRSTIEGRLDCNQASFVCPQASDRNRGGHAIQAIATTIRGGMSLGWRAVGPSVDFTDASTSVLEDDPRTWPSRFYVAGFRYDRFDVPGVRARPDVWDWRLRRRWLQRQVTFDAGPYEQAARVFRRHGYTYGAEQLLISQYTQSRRATRRRLLRPRTWMHAVYGLTVGYGYRPGRVFWLLGLLLMLVSASLYSPAVQATMRATDEAGDVYGTHGIVAYGGSAQPPSDACGNGQVRCFRPVLYAIDTVVPLMSLGQRTTWYPNTEAPWGSAVEWWLNAATVAGWLLSSIFLLSFARLARVT